MYGVHHEELPDAKIGILYQNDDYGKDYRKGLQYGLGEAAKKTIVKQSYEVTDPTSDSQIVNLKNSGANVFFNITIPKFAAQAIKKANDIGWKPVHFLNNVSSSLGTVLKPAGLEASKGLITALYMKEITDPQWKNDKGYQDWVAFMKKYYPEGALDDQSNAFGYNVAILMTQVLKQCGNELSRENIMHQAANVKNFELPLLLPGIKVNTSSTDFAPIEQEQLAKFDGERWGSPELSRGREEVGLERGRPPPQPLSAGASAVVSGSRRIAPSPPSSRQRPPRRPPPARSARRPR